LDTNYLRMYVINVHTEFSGMVELGPIIADDRSDQRFPIFQQEAFEKCWAHSPLRAAVRRIAIHQVSLLSHAATVARLLCIDVHNNDDDDNDNA